MYTAHARAGDGSAKKLNSKDSTYGKLESVYLNISLIFLFSLDFVCKES